jgi:pyrroline-5-carboxylate reductase
MAEALRIGVIGGGGWLGGAIAQAIIAAGIISVEQLTLSYRSTRPSRFPSARWTADNQELADLSDVIIVSVRPADWPALTILARGKLVISVMAGITLDDLGTRLNADRIVRSLPNAAAEVAKSYTPWVASPAVTARDRRLVARVFDACGTSEEVQSEWEVDYLTGLSGSGPAFPALLATAMMRDAVSRGIDPEVARRAVTAVLIGAGRLFENSGESPINTVEIFAAYRGTTAAAIEAMRACGFDAAIATGLEAALHKSKGMGHRA